MVQNAAEGKEDARGVNAEQDCSHTELRIVGNNNKLVYLTFRITAHRSTNSRSHTSTPGVSRKHCSKVSKFEYYLRNRSFQKVVSHG